jgi:hypothetical protein
MLNEGACPPIIGQCDVQCPAAACNQHEPSADNGIANTTITSAQPTSLHRHVMLLLKILRASALRGCDPRHSYLSHSPRP